MEGIRVEITGVNNILSKMRKINILTEYGVNNGIRDCLTILQEQANENRGHWLRDYMACKDFRDIPP